MSRLWLLACWVGSLGAQQEAPAPAWLWHDGKTLAVEGKGWSDTEGSYDRLPKKAKGLVPKPVWGLSKHSAGISLGFETDAGTLKVRWGLVSDKLAMSHMAATGTSGVDLYVDVGQGVWRWLATGRPAGESTEARLFAGLSKSMRRYRLYLPLYNGVRSLEIGVPEGATVKAVAPSPPVPPIVFYGTSITQGGCASRPGMVHTSILGRRLSVPVVNLGFSGNGRMEVALAQLLGELEASVYVLDCLPNMNAQQVAERVEPFVNALRAARPEVPIVLVEDRTFQDAFLVARHRGVHEANRAALRGAFQRLVGAGVKNLTLIAGEDLLGSDGEGTVDGSHPTDLGFMRQADAFQKVLAPLLGR